MAESTDLVIKVRAEFDPPIEEVTRLALRPGEVLVANLSYAPTRDQAARIESELRKLFPDNEVIVLSKGIDLEVVEPGSTEA